MRYLFVHQSFPAQYVHILKHLAKQKKHEIVYITTSLRENIPGVRCVLYTPPPLPSPSVHIAIREFEHAVRRAEAVARIAQSLKQLGFIPDIIIGHHGWGELLNLCDVFPDASMLGYFEFYYQMEGQDVGFDAEFPLVDQAASLVRCKNSINLQALMLPGVGQTPTFFQKRTYPKWAQNKLHLLREGVDLEVCHFDETAKQRVLQIGDTRIYPHEKLITYVARDMEPYRGFHSFMRALPRILSTRSDTQIILVGGDGISYGQLPEKEDSWREALLSELRGRLDLNRIHFVGWRSHEEMMKILQRSNVHVYLTYPFVLSWSLREAMALACPIVASDTLPVREFLKDGDNARLVSFFDIEKISESVLELLENEALAYNLGQKARHDAHIHLDLKDYLRAYEKLIDNTICRRLTPLV